MIVRLRLVLCLMPILAGFAFATSDASAETWNGYLGGIDANIDRPNPGSKLGTVWETSETLTSLKWNCVSYGDGTVFTYAADPDTEELRTVAVDPSDGSIRWSVGSYLDVSGCPAYDDGLVVTGYQRKSDSIWALTARDADDGAVLWEHDFPSGTSLGQNVSMSIAQGRVFSFVRSASTREVRAFNLLDGTQLWAAPGREGGFRGMGPIVSGGTVIVTKPGADLSGPGAGLAAYEISDGSDRGWATSEPDSTIAALAYEGTLFYRRGTKVVVARDIASGSVLWERTLTIADGKYPIGNLVADDERVYAQYGGDVWGGRSVMAFDIDTGVDGWNAATQAGSAWSYLGKYGGYLFLARSKSYPGHRVIIDPDTGQQVGMGTGFPWGREAFSGGAPVLEQAMSERGAFGENRFFEWVPVDGLYVLYCKGDTIPPDVNLSGPSEGAYRATSQTLTWQADDGFNSPMDRFEIQVNGGEVINVPGNQTNWQLTDLPAGENQIEVSAFDQFGNVNSDSVRISIVPSPVPVAELSGPSGPVLAGDNVLFDASASGDAVVDGAITKFEWDLDGNGSFETDGGSSPTISTPLTSLGIGSVGVKVTNDSGNSASKYVSVDIRRKPLPGAGLVGVSINDAAIFTNDPVVKLKVAWPALASDLGVSNDGGFATSSNFPLPANGIIEWTLNSSGPERLPKQVYVRYYGVGNDTVTYSDDIVLDQTAPVIQQVSLIGVVAGAGSSSSGTGVTASKKRKPKRFKVRLKAHDTNSGVVAIQVARTNRQRGPVVQTGKRAKTVKKVINPRVKYRPKLIRVKDAAGNWTKFRKIR